MEKIAIEATKFTPQITLDPSGKVEISGKSFPENTYEFYAPILKWLQAYFETENSPKDLVVNMEIIYFNSSSSKLFFDFFDILDNKKDSFNIQINWIYDEKNESALESGEDFKDDFEDLLINLVAK